MAVVLKKGSKGADVKALQEALNKAKPAPKPPLKIDGIWGPKTDAAFKDFQKKNKLKVDGKAGSATGAAFLKNPGGTLGKKIAEKLGGAEPAPDPKGGGGDEKPVKDRMLKPSYFERMVKQLKAGNELTFGFGIGSGDDSTHKFMMSDELDTGKKAFSRIKIEFKCTKGGGGKVKQLSKTRLELKCEKPIPGLKTKMKGLCASNERMPWTGFVILGADGKELEPDAPGKKDEDSGDDTAGKKVAPTPTPATGEDKVTPTPAPAQDDKKGKKEKKSKEEVDAKKKVEKEDLDEMKEAIATLKKAGYPTAAVLLKKFDELESAMGGFMWLLALPALAALKLLIEKALESWTKELKADFDKKATEAVKALKGLKALSDKRKKDGKDNKAYEADYKKHKKTLEMLVKSKKAYTEKTPLVDALIQDIAVAMLDPKDEKTGPKMIKLIEKRFNVTVDFKQDPKKEGETLKRLYEVMTKAPKFPSSHLKKIEVDLKPKTARGEGAWYDSSDHSVGIETKRPKDSLDYGSDLNNPRDFADPVQDDCKAANNDKVNYFDWATLHEVGHALDTQQKFMDTNQSNVKYGGWTEYKGSNGPIAKAVAAKFAKDHSLDKSTATALEAYTLAVVNKTGKAAAKNAKETAARTDVDDWYKTVNLKGELWWDGAGSKKYQFGGIVYHEAYSGSWVSYQYSERQKGIHGYQFRAPGEWFAELYAAYYSKKLKDSHPFVPDLKKLEK